MLQGNPAIWNLPHWIFAWQGICVQPRLTVGASLLAIAA